MFSHEIIQIPQNLQIEGNFKLLHTPKGQLILNFIGKENGDNKSTNESIAQLYSLKKEKESSDWQLQSINTEKNLDFPNHYPIKSFTQIIDNRGYLNLFICLEAIENELQVFHVISSNYGKRWDEVHCISDDFTSWQVFHDPIIIEESLRVGTIILPLFDRLCNRAFTLISHDNGKTWNQSLFIEPDCLDEDEIHTIDPDDPFTYNPLVFEQDSTTQILLCREGKNKTLATYESNDVGYTWGRNELIYVPIPYDSNFDLKRVYLDKDSQDNTKRVKLLLSTENSYPLLHKSINNEKDIMFDNLTHLKQTSVQSKKTCQIYQDFNKRIHLIFQKTNSSFVHYWGDH